MLAGVVCGADDWQGVEEMATGGLDGLAGFLPFADGIPRAQTWRKVFRLLDAQALERGFAVWAASMRAASREVIAVDDKTLSPSKMSSDGKRELHLVSADATDAGLVLALRAVDRKSNEITAIRNCGTCSTSRARLSRSTAGSNSAPASPPKQSGLAARYPGWKGLHSLAVVAARGITRRPPAKASRHASTSLPSTATPKPSSPRGTHWGIENNLDWMIDMTLDDDRCRTQKRRSPLNFAIIRHTRRNLLKADKIFGSLR